MKSDKINDALNIFYVTTCNDNLWFFIYLLSGENKQCSPSHTVITQQC